VLLVEDHPDTADALALLLRSNGYDVKIGRSLGEGRALAQEPFDVLLCDLQLPDGSGIALMQELSGKPGIAMSGFGSPADVRRSQAAGFRAHLVKPVEIGEVIETIEAIAARG
jgi:two-component system CheB/CheR fusion protein